MKYTYVLVLALISVECFCLEDDSNISITKEETEFVEKLIRTDHAVLIKMYIARIRAYKIIFDDLKMLRNENDMLRAELAQAREELEKVGQDGVRGAK